MSLLGGVLLAAAVAGVALSLRAPGVRGSVICCTFPPVRPADAAVSCLRRGLPEAVYTRYVAPRRPAAPWARLKLFKKGKHFTVDVEVLKRALRELVEREPSFLRDLMLDVLRSDGGAAETLLELLTRHPETKLKLAQVVAGSIAVPLNVATKDDIKAAVEELKKWAEEKFATKEDLKQYATKQDLETAVEQLKRWAEEKFVTKEYFDAVIKRLEDKMATKEQIESITISVEDSGR